MSSPFGPFRTPEPRYVIGISPEDYRRRFMPSETPIPAPETDLAHLAPTSPISAPILGELTTSPTHPSSTKGGRGQSGVLGDVDLAPQRDQGPQPIPIPRERPLT